MYYFGLHNGVYEKPVCHEMASNVPDLTFIHTSFAKIFCQNLVKKNCKFVAGVSSHNICIGHEKDTGSARQADYYGLPDAEISIYYYEKIVGCFRLPRSFIAEISDLCYDNIRLLLRQYQFIVMIKHILRCINAYFLLS